jgi:hypothetical protein
MYLIVNYDWNTRYPEVFYDYKEAKAKFIELNDITNTLEGYNKWYNRRIHMGKDPARKKPFHKNSNQKRK